MIDVVVEQWKRLVLPPGGLMPRVLEQPDQGALVAVDAAEVLWKKHVSGFASYVIEPAWHDVASGQSMVRVGVIELAGETDRTIEQASALHASAASAGLSAALQWTATAGVRIWLFADPVPQETMATALARLMAGEAAVRNVDRLLLVPGWDRAAGGWAYFFRPSERPTPVESEVVPSGLLAYQAEILREISPTPAQHLAAYAHPAGRTPPRELPGNDAAAPTPVGVPEARASSAADCPVQVCQLLSDPAAPVGLMVRRSDGAWEMVRLGSGSALALARDLIEAARRQIVE